DRHREQPAAPGRGHASHHPASEISALRGDDAEHSVCKGAGTDRDVERGNDDHDQQRHDSDYAQADALQRGNELLGVVCISLNEARDLVRQRLLLHPREAVDVALGSIDRVRQRVRELLDLVDERRNYEVTKQGDHPEHRQQPCYCSEHARDAVALRDVGGSGEWQSDDHHHDDGQQQRDQLLDEKSDQRQCRRQGYRSVKDLGAHGLTAWWRLKGIPSGKIRVGMAEPKLTPAAVYKTVLLAFGLIVAGLVFQQLATLILAMLIVVIVALPLSAFATTLERFGVPRPIGVLLGL